MQQNITDDLDALLSVLPPALTNRLHELNQADQLIEIVLDLGRKPEARFTDHDDVLPQPPGEHDLGRGARRPAHHVALGRVHPER